jgi:dUTP pyrophosphatase
MIDLPVQTLPHFDGLTLPAYATTGSAGLDLLAAVQDPVTLVPMQRLLIPTGIAIALPLGFEAQVRPRSGLALKHGLTLPNSPGTIDSDYRGEISVIVLNLGHEAFVVTRGMRIAQLVVARYEQVAWKPTANLDATARGAGGFGSTGTGAHARKVDEKPERPGVSQR